MSRTSFDAKAQDGVSAGHGLEGHGTVPTTATAIGVPGTALDSRLQGEYQATEVAARSYLAPGEQIFGLRLKALRFQYKLWRPTVDNAKLEEDTIWELVSQLRAVVPGQKRQWVEASLEDSDSGAISNTDIDGGAWFLGHEVVFLGGQQDLSSDDSEHED